MGGLVARIVAGVLALFCIYGFAASFEPGVHWAWEAGYGCMFALTGTYAAGLWHKKDASQ